MADTKFEVETGQNTVKVAGKSLVFEAPIADTIKIKDQLLILLNFGTVSEDHPMFERNVILVARDGIILWRIEASTGLRGDIDGGRVHNEYVGLEWRNSANVLVAYDMRGLCFDVDLATGKISNPVFTR